MSKLFNLNIEDYDTHELEELFELKFPFLQNNIIQKGVEIKKKLLTDPQLKHDEKEKVSKFIELAIDQLSLTLTDPVLAPLLQSSKIIENGNHVIIKKKPIEDAGILNPYIISAAEDTDAGLLRQTINIDTTFRKDYYSTSSSDFHISLPSAVKNVIQMKLVACELPQSIYTISSILGNNYFSLRWKISGTWSDVANIILSDGNYLPCVNEGNACERGLQSELNFQLNRSLPHGTGGNINVSVDNRTDKVTFAANGTVPGMEEIELFFNRDISGINQSPRPIQLKLGWLMGFRFGSYTGTTSYTGEGIYDFRGARYLYLSVNDFNNNHGENITGVFSDSITKPENILARLSWLQYVYFATTNAPMDYVTNTRNYFGPVDIQKLHIRLTDSYGRIVELNNMDFSMALEFRMLYKV